MTPDPDRPLPSEHELTVRLLCAVAGFFLGIAFAVVARGGL